MSKITVITPTADQPTGIALLEKYMERQTVQPDQWIVSDDGVESAKLTKNQEHLYTERQYEGGKSLANNMLKALDKVNGDIVLIMEHDDYYQPNHIEICLRTLKNYAASGSLWQRYYNIEHKCYLIMKNVGSALCNTAFYADYIPDMQKAAQKAFNENKYCVDRLFWDALIRKTKTNIHQFNTVVGIKGLPGRKGLGLGHRPDPKRDWKQDPKLEILRTWVGDNIENYI
jgi:glycosyltransferase involved in cell wall biosynthesis